MNGIPVKFKNSNRKNPELKFGKDGKFKILHITDIHEVDPEMDDDENPDIPRDCSVETLNVIEKAIEKTDPDLVVFGGDNISGYWQEFTYEYVRKTIEKICEPIKRRGIPHAIVFGNHDSEIEKFYREFQMMLYMENDNFIGTFNQEEMHGCGNQNIVIKSSDGTRNAFNIWLIDSNDYPRDENGKHTGGYDEVHKNQLDWYEKTEEKLKNENGGKSVPAILFQHIPVTQEYDAIIKVNENENYALKTKDGNCYAFKDEYYVSGNLGELPCVPENKTREQFDLWKKHGDVKAAFFGHDHVNDFVLNVDGIKLVQTFGAGYHTYGEKGGGRVIILDENDPDNIQTESFTVARITTTPL